MYLPKFSYIKYRIAAFSIKNLVVLSVKKATDAIIDEFLEKSLVKNIKCTCSRGSYRLRNFSYCRRVRNFDNIIYFIHFLTFDI